MIRATRAITSFSPFPFYAPGPVSRNNQNFCSRLTPFGVLKGVGNIFLIAGFSLIPALVARNSDDIPPMLAFWCSLAANLFQNKNLSIFAVWENIKKFRAWLRSRINNSVVVYGIELLLSLAVFNTGFPFGAMNYALEDWGDNEALKTTVGFLSWAGICVLRAGGIALSVDFVKKFVNDIHRYDSELKVYVIDRIKFMDRVLMSMQFVWLLPIWWYPYTQKTYKGWDIALDKMHFGNGTICGNPEDNKHCCISDLSAAGWEFSSLPHLLFFVVASRFPVETSLEFLDKSRPYMRKSSAVCVLLLSLANSIVSFAGVLTLYRKSAAPDCVLQFFHRPSHLQIWILGAAAMCPINMLPVLRTATDMMKDWEKDSKEQINDEAEVSFVSEAGGSLRVINEEKPSPRCCGLFATLNRVYRWVCCGNRQKENLDLDSVSLNGRRRSLEDPLLLPSNGMAA